MTFTQEDRDLLARKGISESLIEEQLSCFKQGFPFLKLNSPASIGNGILSIDEKEMDHYLKIWEEYLTKNPVIVKFVPASGAASRMFKNLFEFLDADYNTPSTDFEKNFSNKLHILHFMTI